VKYSTHYTTQEARALLPQIQQWLKELNRLQKQLQQLDQRVGSLMSPGCDAGGTLINKWVRTMGDTQTVLLEFLRREIQVKDLERGLIDFPALKDGKEVFLCWEMGETDIEFWHDLDAGYAGREPLP
jgi:hypothetical protein